MTETLPIPVTSPITNAQQKLIINLVRRAAKAEILPRFRQLDSGDIATKRDENDLVTAADISAEAMIGRGLQASFPHAVVIGEEAAAKNPKLVGKLAEAELSFVIDPVDGTWNFARGVPLFGTMIAVCRFGTPIFGLIYDPIGDDVIFADSDHPALLQTARGRRRPIHTSKPKAGKALSGYMHLTLMPEAGRALCHSKLDRFGYVGNLRCSAHEYRLIATGAMDFSLSHSLHPWDHLAGTLICRQAGGKAAMLDGSAYNGAITEGYMLTACSEEVWDEVASSLAGLLNL